MTEKEYMHCKELAYLQVAQDALIAVNLGISDVINEKEVRNFVNRIFDWQREITSKIDIEESDEQSGGDDDK